MDPLVFVLVAGAAVLHVTWNVLLKTAGDPLRAAAVGMATAAAVICPLAFAIWLASGRPAIPTETLVLSVVSGLLEALYFAFLASAYRRGDLSLVYPLARGSAPLLAVAIGVVLLNERLGPVGYAGVAALLVGLLPLQRPWRSLQASHGPMMGVAPLLPTTVLRILTPKSTGVCPIGLRNGSRRLPARGSHPNRQRPGTAVRGGPGVASRRRTRSSRSSRPACRN